MFLLWPPAPRAKERVRVERVEGGGGGRRNPIMAEKEIREFRLPLPTTAFSPRRTTTTTMVGAGEKMKKRCDSVEAIVITHAHGDHTRGARLLSRRHGVPVYSTPGVREEWTVPDLSAWHPLAPSQPLASGRCVLRCPATSTIPDAARDAKPENDGHQGTREEGR